MKMKKIDDTTCVEYVLLLKIKKQNFDGILCRWSWQITIITYWKNNVVFIICRKFKNE